MWIKKDHLCKVVYKAKIELQGYAWKNLLCKLCLPVSTWRRVTGGTPAASCIIIKPQFRPADAQIFIYIRTITLKWQWERETERDISTKNKDIFGFAITALDGLLLENWLILNLFPFLWFLQTCYFIIFQMSRGVNFDLSNQSNTELVKFSGLYPPVGSFDPPLYWVQNQLICAWLLTFYWN